MLLIDNSTVDNPSLKQQSLPFSVPSDIYAVELFDCLPSTNDYLLRLASTIDPAHAYYFRNIACLAERQTAGKGRRGRAWISPPNNIYLSILWHFPVLAGQLGGLSLALACAVAGVVQTLTSDLPQALSLKWPNDVFWGAKKLGGILIELTQSAIPLHSSLSYVVVVIGVALNLQISLSEEEVITQPYTDLASILQSVPDRNAVLSLLLHRLVEALNLFQAQGFSPFVPQWNALDNSLGKSVTLITDTMTMQGVGRGIDLAGQFLLEVPSGSIVNVPSGDIDISILL